MADHVFVGEVNKLDSFEVCEYAFRFDQAATFSSGRSTCVTSPVITAFEPKPMRVRNIFICSLVVFCASSRMMNASESVRPRMNASGATSMTRFSSRR